jgi:8-oxo-dGTP pyrophosphatase MutT (NUDIX family)
MTILRQKTLYTGRVITLNLETVQLPNGHVADLEIIHHPGGAAIAALDDEGRVCLLRQFRHAAGGWIWELPAGKLEPAEPPLRTAQRELIEEAGREADNWLSLGSYVSSPGVFTEVVHLFLATGLRKANISHEPAEAIEIHWVDFDEACARALHGEINDGKTVLGLLRSAALVRDIASESMGKNAKSSKPPASTPAEPAAPKDEPTLSLEDTMAQAVRGLRTPHSVSGSGYNPYDTIPNTSSTGAFQGTDDLRRLSEWIRTKRMAEILKKEDDPEKDPEKDPDKE